jgi:predicted dehydrogenase
MTQKVRWAMVGTGLMADLIIRDFALCDNTELAAIVTRNVEAAKPKLAAWGVDVPLVGSLEEALHDPSIDLIYVASPHSEHYWMTKAALEAGKHVLCEKAFMMNQSEAVELTKLAKEKGLFLMEAMWTKFNPLMNELKRRIDAGAIGKLKVVEANFGFHRTYDTSHRLFDAHLGGGSTLDQGVYTTSVISWFADSEVVEQFSRGELYPNMTDALAVTEFRFANGVIGIGSSSLSTSLGAGARLVGEDAYIEIDPAFWTPVSATLYRFDSNDQLVPERIEVPKDGAGYAHMIRRVSEQVLAGETECPERSHAESVMIMGLLDEIRGQLGAPISAYTKTEAESKY